jgi:hypothetical protein
MFKFLIIWPTKSSEGKGYHIAQSCRGTSLESPRDQPLEKRKNRQNRRFYDDGGVRDQEEGGLVVHNCTSEIRVSSL